MSTITLSTKQGIALLEYIEELEGLTGDETPSKERIRLANRALSAVGTLIAVREDDRLREKLIEK